MAIGNSDATASRMYTIGQLEGTVARLMCRETRPGLAPMQGVLRIQVNPEKSRPVLRELQGMASCTLFELILRRGSELRRLQVNPEKSRP